MKIQVQLDKNAKMPTKGYKDDAAFDLYSNQLFTTIEPGKSEVFKTGTHMNIPKGYCGLLISKSGMNVNHGIQSVGLIDSGYHGEIMVKLYNHSDKPYTVFRGDKISQILVLPIPIAELEKVDEFDEDTERGDKGFGSTGKS